MPRDVQNSSSNIFNCKVMYVDFLFSDNPIGTDISADGFVFLRMYSPGSNLPVSSQLKTVVDGVFVDPDWSDFLGLEENPFPETYVFKNTSIQTTLALRVSDAIINEASDIDGDVQGLLNSKLLLVFGSTIFTFLSTISEGESLPDEIAAAAEEIASTELTTLNPFKTVGEADAEGEADITEYKLVGVTSSVVDGDQMRGPYAKVRINISDTTPFELHAINVDYSFSKLDARLTQNS